MKNRISFSDFVLYRIDNLPIFYYNLMVKVGESVTPFTINKHQHH